MFTKNYIRLQRMHFLNADISGVVDCNGQSITADKEYSHYDGLGCELNVSSISTFPTTYGSSASSMPSGVHFGTGSTPATEADYKLESPITSGLSFSTGGIIETAGENGKYTFRVNRALTNTSEAEINIYEIGLFVAVPNTSKNFYCVLLERTVLTEPITIPAGETRFVSYEVIFNQTLNVE